MTKILIYTLYLSILILVLQGVIDVWKSKENNLNKLVWICVIVLFPIAGSFIYFRIKNNRRRTILKHEKRRNFRL